MQLPEGLSDNLKRPTRSCIPHISEKLSNEQESSAKMRPSPIPARLTSPQTLAFIGFSRYAASVIFQKHLETWPQVLRDIPETSEDDYLRELAVAYMHHIDDVFTEKGNWEMALFSMGASASLVEAICDPRFRSLRDTRTAGEWFLDTIVESRVYLGRATKNGTHREWWLLFPPPPSKCLDRHVMLY